MRKINEDALVFFDNSLLLRSNLFPVDVDEETITFLASGNFNERSLRKAISEIIPFEDIKILKASPEEISQLKIEYMEKENSFIVSSKEHLIFPPPEKLIDEKVDGEDFFRYIIFYMIKNKKTELLIERNKGIRGFNFSYKKLSEFFQNRKPSLRLLFDRKKLNLYFEISENKIYLEVFDEKHFLSSKEKLPTSIFKKGLKILIGGEPLKDQLLLQLLIKSVAKEEKCNILVPKRFLSFNGVCVFTFSLKLFSKMFNYFMKTGRLVYIENPPDLYYLFLWSNSKNIVATLPLKTKDDFLKRIEYEKLHSALKGANVKLYSIEYEKKYRRGGKISPYRVKISELED